MHNGQLNDSRFGVRMSGQGKAAELISRLFRLTCRRLGLNPHPWPVSADAFKRPLAPGQEQQKTLFD